MDKQLFNLCDRLKEKVDEIHPLKGNTLDKIKDYYRVSTTWSSNALEGNTLTESETKVLLEDGLTAAGKPLIYALEAFGHGKAYDFMFSLLGTKEITEKEIKQIHKLFYVQIDSEYAGNYRIEPVFISGSQHPVSSVESIEEDIHMLCNWIEMDRNKYHPVEFAAMLHKRFIFIHPFLDGNGRCARLLMNTALIQDGYLPCVIPPVLRNEYIDNLEHAHQDEYNFINFIAEVEYETEKDFLRLLNIKI